jgi:hypothetical protein
LERKMEQSGCQLTYNISHRITRCIIPREPNRK